MEVMRGYKQTEVGVIPEDWDVKSASQIGTTVRGGSPRPAGDPRFFNGSYIPWLTVAALTNLPDSKLIVSETATSLTEEGSLHSRTLVPGTVIIANSGATLGVAKILGVKCCANDGIAAILNLSRRISPHYLAHYINTRTHHLRDAVATGNGQPNLNTELIGNFKLPLPPTKAEQEAIAEALSDGDALIESIEQLIAKKRHLKHAAMKELLTGKKRLPGFRGSWNTTSLENGIALLSGHHVLAEHCNTDGKGYPYITGPSDFPEGEIRHSKFTDRPTTICHVNDILITVKGSGVGSMTISNGDYCISRQLMAIRVDRIWDAGFIFHSLLQDSSLIGAAATGLIPGITRGDLLKKLIAIPQLDEQREISAILFDMKAEITALEIKLAKARRIRQGMMQELLTGRTRLI